ncbi:hypothetical protein GLOTRDRAFT_54265 [Gloeophyllum trabeum ATCC 11539]|uniref:DUF7223 domain-containing protein n=1 Tax=Gloeophyllum trabeum (strain ATCC 11539 / FP-39264 / Madison 617) TaxID=670483 RepID=S7QPM5_GLOTA|nr:uncharacterized protein GLOTRDRAFT_54265 [Gloeophyllum trabeum ATCC 11539]EPQ61342.1 hypothetical protein GLOTRDRAFT_54265 [Gloeophyllum trabeum ATCC 11539]
MIHSFLALAPFVIAAVSAANDWSQPCTNGECYYDVNGTVGQASGTMKVWGPTQMLSDITSAAGWQILSCDQNASAQDIRLVCMNETAGCSHVYQNGAENTLVRLPENCGVSPFARVAKAWVSTNQSMPDSLKAKLTRRDGTVPQVMGMSLDTSWHSMDASQGNISIVIQGASVPGQTGPIDTSGVSLSRRSRLAERGLGSIIGDGAKKFNSFNKSLDKTIPPINVNKDFNLGSSSVSCKGFDATFAADIDTSFNADVTYGVVAAGTIIPPKISSFMLFANFDADIDGKLNLQASASGILDTGKVELFSVGIPGLDIPKIFTLGPSFEIDGQITTNAEIDVDMTVDLAYKVTDAKLFFPKAAGGTQNGGTFAPQDSPLKLSVSPNVQADVSITAHLIPSLDFGIQALGNTVSAKVFLDLDASATLDLQLNAQGNVTVTGSGKNSTATTTAKSSTATATSSGSAKNATATATSTAGKNETETATSTGRSIETGSMTSANGTATSVSMSKETGSMVLANATASSTSMSTATASTNGTASSTLMSKETASMKSANATASSTTMSKETASVSSSKNATESSTSMSGSASKSAAASSSMAKSTAMTTSTTANSTASSGVSVVDVTVTATSDASIATETPAVVEARELVPRADTTASGSVDGCITIDAGLSVNAGAQGSFFDIFNDATQVTLFQKDFELFQKCFGTATPTRRRSVGAIVPFGRRLDRSRRAAAVSPVRRQSSVLAKRLTITCPASAPPKAASVADETVKGSTEKTATKAATKATKP